MFLKSGSEVIQSHWKIVTIDRAYTASYQSAIVSVALSRTMFELFDIEEYCDLEI